MAVPRLLREGPRSTSAPRHGQLGPGRQTVLANEQVIDGRGWRLGRARREARDPHVLHEDHRLRADELLQRSTPRRAGRSRSRLMQKNWIGRSEGVASLPVRQVSDGHEGCGFTTRADTMMGATFVAVAAEHPLATQARPANPANSPSSSRECKRAASPRSRHRDDGKEDRHADRPLRAPSADRRAVEVWVANYVLMGYGDRRGDGGAGARRARLRLRQKVRPADPHGGRPPAIPDTVAPGRTPTRRVRAPGEFRQSTTASISRRAVDAIAADLAQGLGDKKVQFRLRDWGISRQRYWGLPDPDHPLRRLRRRAGADEQLPVVLPENVEITGPARRWQDGPRSTNAPARSAAASRPSARPTPWTPSSSRPGTSCATPAPTTTAMVDERVDYWCRSTSTSAASSTPSCTCCTRAFHPRDARRRPGEGPPSPSPTC